MELSELLKPDLMITNLQNKTKKDIINDMVNMINKDYTATQKKRIKQALLDREKLGSTAIGGGIALPHIRMKLIKKWTLIVAFSKQGFHFGSIDNQKTHVVFMLLQPQADGLSHLKIFSQLSTLFRNPNTLKQLLKIHTNQEFFQVLDQCLHQPV